MNTTRAVLALACCVIGLNVLPNQHRAKNFVPGSAIIPAVVQTVQQDATNRRRGAESGDFRMESSTEIETCALALEGMTRRAAEGSAQSRNYLATRLKALREHVDYARDELLKLPANQTDASFIPAHAHFYRTMTGLKQAFTQAATELNGDI